MWGFCHIHAALHFPAPNWWACIMMCFMSLSAQRISTQCPTEVMEKFALYKERIRAAFVLLGTPSTKDYYYPCVVQDQFKIISLRAFYENPLPVTLLTCFLFWESTGLKGQSQKRPHLYRVCFHPHKGSQTMPVPAGGLLNGMRTKGFLCLLFIH